MKRLAILSTTALLLAACSSTPTMDRPGSPDTSGLQRADSVAPDGLTDMRSQIADQRAAARERDNALSTRPTTLSQAPGPSFLENVFNTTYDALHFFDVW